jgi:formylglycine-generating enzyme required for sulfatase activity
MKVRDAGMLGLDISFVHQALTYAAWLAKDRCNFNMNVGDTTPVGQYPQGASPYGVLDTAGNVWEWMSSLWGKDVSKPDFKYPL